MNRIEKLVLRGAGYTVLFMILYFLIAAITGFEDIRVTAGRFFLVLLFGYVMAMANFIFESVNISVWLKRLCVYAISALAFFFIFVLGNGIGTTGAKIFASLIIYTAIYAVGLAIVCLVRRTVGGAKKSTAETDKKSNTSNAKKYKSLYEDKK